MRWRRTLPALILLSGLLPGLMAPAAAQQKPVVKCATGPITKTIGSEKWLVYSCDDERTVVVIAAPGNPVAPYYFVLSPDGVGYKLTGEGTGPKDKVGQAYNALKILTEREIQDMLRETRTR